MQLIRERLAHGWSQAELARRSGMNATTICLIESGRFRPYEAQVEKLARALGCAPSQLGSLTGDAPASADPDLTANPHARSAHDPGRPI